MRRKIRALPHKIGICLAIISICLTFCQTSAAAGASNNYNPETVFDYADLLTAQEEASLRDYSTKFDQYDISVIFLTTNNAEGLSTTTYSDDFYDTNQFRNDGVLFVIDMDNRMIYINTVGSCIDMISGSDINRALDDAYMYASEGDYYRCFTNMSNSICTEIENQENPLSGALRFSPVTLVIAVIIKVIVVIVLISQHNAANKKTSGERYVGSNFAVNNRNVVYMGCRREVIPGYYNPPDQKSGGSGSGRHTSSRGVSHGGGGRKF